ncbi:hypothetical protein HanXRQr2_Chr08g0332781 [Helianthus annuus]|uniref:Uncharacterized protein n=1 Tax=Helianthus annuus TaxID=4232 RepID=A0A9K3IDP5_HELAN|nr:hypothetical protein HanXRQr2_Chr08g0332781 [Helianthus annuus]
MLPCLIKRDTITRLINLVKCLLDKLNDETCGIYDSKLNLRDLECQTWKFGLLKQKSHTHTHTRVREIEQEKRKRGETLVLKKASN